MSSVVPSDSVSSANNKKKSKPGKAERAAKRAASQASGAPASAQKAAQFAASAGSSPSPEPGRYPVVFQTGAGEPSRDREFAYDVSSLSSLATSFYARYQKNPRYAEFRAHAGVTDSDFFRQVTAAFLLGLAQKTVHAHVNMGFPQLDFGPVSTTELRLPAAHLAVLTQFGEFSEPNLGTRFVFGDYATTVNRLILAATRIWTFGRAVETIQRAWLPMSGRDRTTKIAIAAALREFIASADLAVAGTELEDAVLSGDVPEFWTLFKPAFGSAPGDGDRDERDRFDFLFKQYQDVGQFYAAFTTPEALSVLRELGLEWDNPDAGHLDWNFVGKVEFASLADKWARVSAAYAQFFELGSSLADRANARGSPAQFVDVSTIDVVTVVKTFVALSAPQFSLAACFPPECIFAGGVIRNVIMSTPLSIEQRATEFVLQDWR